MTKKKPALKTGETAPEVVKTKPTTPDPGQFAIPPGRPRVTQQGMTNEELRAQVFTARARQLTEATISKWKRDPANEGLKFDRASLFQAFLKQVREETEQQEREQAERRQAEKRREREREARRQVERRKAEASLAERLGPEELAGRLLDLVEHCQRNRLFVPVDLLA